MTNTPPSFDVLKEEIQHLHSRNNQLTVREDEHEGVSNDIHRQINGVQNELEEASALGDIESIPVLREKIFEISRTIKRMLKEGMNPVSEKVRLWSDFQCLEEVRGTLAVNTIFRFGKSSLALPRGTKVLKKQGEIPMQYLSLYLGDTTYLQIYIEDFPPDGIEIAIDTSESDSSQ